MLYATMRIGNNCEYFLFQSVPELTKLSIEGNIAHNKGLIFTQLMQYAVWEKQQQFGSALGLF